jgi:hypothetical protein
MLKSGLSCFQQMQRCFADFSHSFSTFSTRFILNASITHKLTKGERHEQATDSVGYFTVDHRRHLFGMRGAGASARRSACPGVSRSD